MHGEYEKKYSFIVHTEQGKLAHEWQEEIVSELTERLTEAAMRSDNTYFRQLSKPNLSVFVGITPNKAAIMYQLSMRFLAKLE